VTGIKEPIVPVSEATYRRVAMEDDEQWELVCGRLRKKPPMTTEHQGVGRQLTRSLFLQLDWDEFIFGPDIKVRTSTGSYFVPDVTVVPRALERRLREQPGTFEVYDAPLPLIVEVWSPSTGEYDVDKKLAEYRHRGDLEIWRIHPYERTLIAWVRRPNGTYTETLYTSGTIRLTALPSVVIDLSSLFD
jgi:Uma2 family endonuclease